MKLKYYLRGLGIGIIVTTIILTIGFSGREEKLSDTEIIARAKQLGMVMPEKTDTEATEPGSEAQTESQTAAEDGGVASPAENTAQDENIGAEAEPNDDAADLDPAGTDGEAAQPDVGVADGTVPPQEGTYRLTIRRGDVARVVCEDLAANGVTDDSEALRKYLLEIGYASFMSTGDYDIPYGLTKEEIARVLQAGPIQE